jgi:hypothetical protein
LVIVLGTGGVIIGASVRGARSTIFELSDKALRVHGAPVYVTDPSRVVYVPTTDGYSLLLSVAETDQFLDQLHAMKSAGASPGSAP